MKPQLKFKEWLSQQPVNEIGGFLTGAIALGRQLAGKGGGERSNALTATDLPAEAGGCTEEAPTKTKEGCMKVMNIYPVQGDDGEEQMMVRGWIDGKPVVLPCQDTDLRDSNRCSGKKSWGRTG
jgi:hypothetical protein